MSRVVWKYELEVTDQQTVEMPAGAQILHVSSQRGTPCLWVLCDPAAPTTQRTILTKGTGHDLPEEELVHLGSYLLLGGDFVGHLFEKVPF